jgi:hypothetical protein
LHWFQLRGSDYCYGGDGCGETVVLTSDSLLSTSSAHVSVY